MSRFITTSTCGMSKPLKRVIIRMLHINYRPQRSWGKVIFSQASVILSTQGGVHGCWGACMVSRGHAWLLGGMHGCGGVCGLGGGMCGCPGGMCGCQGACMVAWGACMVAGGMCCCQGDAWLPRGCVWLWGACMVAGGGACIGHDEIRSISGRYASYWNAFLCKKCLNSQYISSFNWNCLDHYTLCDKTNLGFVCSGTHILCD